jgi:hypothetical protein
METVKLSELRPHAYINYNGEIIGKEKAEQIIASGEKSVLFTVSDEFIEASLMALSEDRKAGRPLTDYCAPDPHAKLILY